MKTNHKRTSDIPDKVLTRQEYQEILLARMAGGDLYANEDRIRIRRVDMMLDKLRIAGGGNPLYTKELKK